MTISIKTKAIINFMAPAFFCIALVSGCKKSELKSSASSSAPDTSSVPVTSDYLGQYGITELGSLLSGKIDLTKTIYCYTDKISYMAGDSVSLYISGPKTKSQTVAMTDMNDHTILSVNVPIDIQQIQTDRPWLNGLGFTKTTTIKLPNDLKSGIYKFCGNQNIVVKNNSLPYDITVIYPSNTDNAYNQAGRKSLYAPDQPNRSTVVSFSRFQFGSADYSSSFFKWLALQKDYKINYISDADVDDYSQIERSKLVIITGHSEYWTRHARQNIDKFVATGKNLLVLAGDVMWWQVRYNLQKNIMICYRDKAIDPLGNTPYSTVLWGDKSLNYSTLSSIGADFNHGGYANQVPNAWNGYKIVNEKSPLFKGTGLKNGDILKLPTYECDGAPVIKMIKPGSSEVPVIDNRKLKFLRIELLAYDFAVDGNANGLATFIVFQKTKTSGTVVNVATENWCSSTGIGGEDKTKIEMITKNMIDNSLAGNNLF